MYLKEVCYAIVKYYYNVIYSCDGNAEFSAPNSNPNPTPVFCHMILQKSF